MALEDDIGDLTRMKGHSYRNFSPGDWLDVVGRIHNLDDDIRAVDALKSFRSEMGFIEGGRFVPFLDVWTSFFRKLDTDERELFTRRNPDIAQWIHVYARSQEMGDYERWYEMGGGILNDSGSFADNSGDMRDYDRLPQPSYAPPPFESDDPDRSLVKDFIRRRKSYRNWSPFEFLEVMPERDTDVAVSPGTALDLDYHKQFAEDEDMLKRLQKMRDRGETIDIRQTTIALLSIRLIEKGRFEDALNESWTLYNPLDGDERAVFALRNPGVATWLGVWGRAKGVVFRPDGMFNDDRVSWPLIEGDVPQFETMTVPQNPTVTLRPSRNALETLDKRRESSPDLAENIETTLAFDHVPAEIHEFLAPSNGALGFGWQNDGPTVSIRKSNFNDRVTEGEQYIVTFGRTNQSGEAVLYALGTLVEHPGNKQGDGVVNIAGTLVPVKGWQLREWVSDEAIQQARSIVASD